MAGVTAAGATMQRESLWPRLAELPLVVGVQDPVGGDDRPSGTGRLVDLPRHDPLCLARVAEAPQDHVMAGDQPVVGQPEASRQFRRRPGPWQRQQRQRVAPALCEQPGDDFGVEGRVDVRQQQRSCLEVVEPADRQLGSLAALNNSWQPAVLRMVQLTATPDADTITGKWDVYRDGMLVCGSCVGKA